MHGSVCSFIHKSMHCIILHSFTNGMPPSTRPTHVSVMGKVSIDSGNFKPRRKISAFNPKAAPATPTASAKANPDGTFELWLEPGNHCYGIQGSGVTAQSAA